MKSEKEKMLAGELYDPLDEQLVEERIRARKFLKALIDTSPDNEKLIKETIKALMPNSGDGLYVQPPFYCDYGYNIETGKNVFFNFNCVVLDVMQVRIGDQCLFGPNVQIYTAMHPMNFEERAKGLEFAKPVMIGNDVWIGGSVVICPGVTIGDRSIIGAGSVVTKDIPSDVFAAGNPCKVIRTVNEAF
jgi:maltose O-acetyltransferase